MVEVRLDSLPELETLVDVIDCITQPLCEYLVHQVWCSVGFSATVEKRELIVSLTNALFVAPVSRLDRIVSTEAVETTICTTRPGAMTQGSLI